MGPIQLAFFPWTCSSDIIMDNLLSASDHYLKFWTVTGNKFSIAKSASYAPDHYYVLVSFFWTWFIFTIIDYPLCKP